MGCSVLNVLDMLGCLSCSGDVPDVLEMSGDVQNILEVLGLLGCSRSVPDVLGDVQDFWRSRLVWSEAV